MLHFFWSGYVVTEKSFEKYEFSNLEIAKWAEYYLSQNIPFNQTGWWRGRVTENSDDILIGHPTWDGRSPMQKAEMGKLIHNWVRDNALSPDDLCHPNTYILMPWVPEFPEEWTTQMPFWREQLRAAKKIFGLCGSFWIEETLRRNDDSIQSEVKDKLIHCNMGIAAQNFKEFKKRFNDIGDRQILHMSNLATYKGFDITCESLLGVDTLLHVASKTLAGEPGLRTGRIKDNEITFNFLGKTNNSDSEFNHWVVETCDFYIHTARMDAQATTVLEACVRGLIPLVTPESGFSSPHAIYLTQDADENRKIIDWALNLPESDLLKRSQMLREQIVQEHSWSSIFGRIWQEICHDTERNV